MKKKSKLFPMQHWRIPPDLQKRGTYVVITVPSGSTLSIEYLYSSDAVCNPSIQSRPLFTSHLGFSQMCPQNTRPAIEMAGILGYSACIVVPKTTSDGVLVCVHDDTINSTARDESGNAPQTEMAVADMTYNDLLAWDFGLSTNEYWRGTRILTVDEFFGICAKYGMSPVFSTHPALSSEQWQNVKTMLIKHGLLDRFWVKAFSISILESAYAVFGQAIAGYTGEYDNSYVTVQQLSDFVSTHGIDTAKCHVQSEVSVSTITQAIAASIISAGLECGVYTLGKSNSAADVKSLMAMGVIQFSDDVYCQNGMNW